MTTPALGEHAVTAASSARVDAVLDSQLRDGVAAWATLAQALQDPTLQQAVTDAGRALVEALQAGNKVLVAGNGGSAAIASHVAAEFLGKCVQDRRPLPAVNLAESLSSITAIGNDYGYDEVFVRGVQALGRRGDVLIAMSTSGRSANVIKALECAGALGVVTIAMTGESPGRMGELADHTVAVPSTYTPRIQEVHMLWAHAWCEAVDVLSQPHAGA